MKELTIEEKAKAYDEAVTKSIEFYTLCKKCGAKGTVDFLEDIFPELKESEDERIRKEIIDSIKELRLIGTPSYREKAIAWLEKQGGQKSDWSEEDDLVEELDYDDYIRFFNEHPGYNNDSWGFDEAWKFAQYFYKLGLKTKKGGKE